MELTRPQFLLPQLVCTVASDHRNSSQFRGKLFFLSESLDTCSLIESWSSGHWRIAGVSSGQSNAVCVGPEHAGKNERPLSSKLCRESLAPWRRPSKISLLHAGGTFWILKHRPAVLVVLTILIPLLTGSGSGTSSRRADTSFGSPNSTPADSNGASSELFCPFALLRPKCISFTLVGTPGRIQRPSVLSALPKTPPLSSSGSFPFRLRRFIWEFSLS